MVTKIKGRKLDAMHPGPRWYHSCASQGDHDNDTLASNAALHFYPGSSMSSSTTVITKLFDQSLQKAKASASHPDDPLHVTLTPSDFRSRAGRPQRISSHLRVYHDDSRSPTSPISAIPSPQPKELTLPPFPSPISSPAPESKTRPHEPRSRNLLYGLDESPTFWLVVYFLSNLALTLYNKSVLIQFPFPYTLTALHALCSTAGSSVVMRVSASSPHGSSRSLSLSRKEIITLVCFSMLFTINIAVSNISLDLVTVPVRSTPVRASRYSSINIVSSSGASHDPHIYDSFVANRTRKAQQS